jgi:hypothetical protein
MDYKATTSSFFTISYVDESKRLLFDYFQMFKEYISYSCTRDLDITMPVFELFDRKEQCWFLVWLKQTSQNVS